MIEKYNFQPPNYCHHNLLDTLIAKMRLKSDADLCRVLEVNAPVISKIRHGRLPVGPTILLRMHEESNLSIRELKSLLADSKHTVE